jgi:hypothetical protein
MHETEHEVEGQAPQVDPLLAVSVTLAELEILRANAALSQLQIAGPDEHVRDLSPLGQRTL